MNSHIKKEAITLAKAELGTKRVCPETERKFYDLNRDPIISPYTGQSYPLTFFEKPEDEPVEEVKKEEETAEAVVEPTTPELDEDGEPILDDDGEKSLFVAKNRQACDAQ